MEFEKAIIIRDKTRLEQLIERFNSRGQAKFYIERSGGDFQQYEKEHVVFYQSLKTVEKSLIEKLKYKVIFRDFLPTYIFTENDMVVVVGQDGLVANTAKYVSGLPIMAINPDAKQYDGVLLAFTPDTFKQSMQDLLKHKYSTESIVMAEALLDDGQRLLAFNDLFIGAASHVSSRYTIQFKGKEEQQSSSGIIVSTGAGSTGWLSSVFNMANNVGQYLHQGQKKGPQGITFQWDEDKLIFVVREPFLSQVTQADIGFGVISKNQKLTITSKMPNNGVIFSDGVEADFLKFNTGSTVTIGVAKEKARLVVYRDA